MNALFHILFGYIIIELGFGNANQYIIPIIIASTIIDLDHIPYLIIQNKNLLKIGLGERSRTVMQELLGLLLISIVIFVLFFFVADKMLLKVVYLSLILHFAVDFATGKTRPFLPFSKEVLVSPFVPQERKKKVVFEIIMTSIAGVVFWVLL